MTDLFDFRPARRSYAVMGNPVAHSKSPVIHQQFAEQCGISLDYDCVQVDVGGFEQAVSHFGAHGGAGLNVTVPFKVDAWRLCQRGDNTLSEEAALAESVNTLTFNTDGSISGANTDGIGLVQDVEQNLGRQIAGSRVLVVGAGGAVRGVLGPLLGCKPLAIHVTNRTAAKASALAERFAELGYSGLSAVSMDRIEAEYDLVINGTAASLGGDLPDIDRRCMGAATLAYDMMYGSKPTLFMKWALDAGCNEVADGLGMLVEQAARSFGIWHNKQPDTMSVINYLRKQ